MRGLGKFLFGGLLGAIIGFLISPKRGLRVREALLTRDTRAVPSWRRAVPQSLPVPRQEPPAVPVAPPAPAPAVTVVEGPPPAEVEESPAVPEAPSAEAEAVETPAAPAPEPPAPAPPAVEPARIEPAAVEPAVAPWAVEGIATEAPLEEPPIPDVPEDMPRDAVAESPVWPDSSVESQPEPLVVVPEPERPSVPAPAAASMDLKTRIEETRRRIQRELDTTFVVRPDEQEPAAAAIEREAPVVELAAAPVAGLAEAPVQEPVEAPVEFEPPQPAFAVPALSFQPSIVETSELPDAVDAPEPPDTVEAGDRPEPAADRDSATFDQEAMRRRIEETRSRLKAKAFDALMSGEAALLSRDSGSADQTAGRGAGPEIDAEVEETIESTLSEEDV